MEAILKLCLIGMASGVGVIAFRARADLEVSAAVRIHAAADFYGPLAPDGTWIKVGTYGRCWRPAGVAAGWQPYCYGHWVWTDCGWYWASDEPWGWACYHYGYWIDDPSYGWVWIPGIEWAPAWVSWRVGGGYIGWAPLGPRGVVAGSRSFVFVAAARFERPIRPSTVIANDSAILSRTTVINNIKQETRRIGAGGRQRVVVNEGPGLAEIPTASRQRIKAVPIGEAARQAAMPAGVSHGPGEVERGSKRTVTRLESPKYAPQTLVRPLVRPERPAPSSSPGFEKKPPTTGPAPAPHWTPTPARPAGSGRGPSEGEGKGHEPEGDPHDKG